MALVISISGAPGSGKSSVGRLLAQRLGIPFFSMGDIRRKYGVERGLSIAELNHLSENDPASDRLVDEYQSTLPQKYPSFVIDSRLGYYFLPSSFKIFIDVDLQTGAQRILSNARQEEQWTSIDQGVQALRERIASDTARYHALYGVSWNDLSQFDMVVDSTSLSLEEMAKNILDVIHQRGLLS